MTADEIFCQELENIGLSYEINDEGLYLVKVGEQKVTVNLENVRRDYLRDKSLSSVQSLVEQLTTGPFAAPVSWEEAKPLVRFSLEPNDYIEGLENTLHLPVTDRLIKLCVLVSPDGRQIAWITSTIIQKWRCSEKDVYSQADANMNLLIDQTALEVGETRGIKLGMVSLEETPFKASLLVAKKLRELVKDEMGWPVYAVAPARDFVYLISVGGEDLFGQLGTVVMKEYSESGYPVIDEVLLIGDEGIKAVGRFNR